MTLDPLALLDLMYAFVFVSAPLFPSFASNKQNRFYSLYLSRIVYHSLVSIILGVHLHLRRAIFEANPFVASNLLIA